MNPKNHCEADISFMVWGCIWREGRSELIFMKRDPTSKRQGYTFQSYIKALQKGLPIYDDTRHFQQDNAKIHRSQVAEDWLNRHGITWIDWPAHSPDLNPIEHVWAAMKRRLYKLFPHLASLKRNSLDIEEFKACLRIAWEAVPTALVQRLFDTMENRLQAVKKARGWYTKY